MPPYVILEDRRDVHLAVETCGNGRYRFRINAQTWHGPFTDDELLDTVTHYIREDIVAHLMLQSVDTKEPHNAR